MAFARKELLGIFRQHFNLPHLSHYICLLVLRDQTLLVTPSLVHRTIAHTDPGAAPQELVRPGMAFIPSALQLHS